MNGAMKTTWKVSDDCLSWKGGRGQPNKASTGVGSMMVVRKSEANDWTSRDEVLEEGRLHRVTVFKRMKVQRIAQSCR